VTNSVFTNPQFDLNYPPYLAYLDRRMLSDVNVALGGPPTQAEKLHNCDIDECLEDHSRVDNTWQVASFSAWRAAMHQLAMVKKPSLDELAGTMNGEFIEVSGKLLTIPHRDVLNLLHAILSVFEDPDELVKLAAEEAADNAAFQREQGAYVLGNFSQERLESARDVRQACAELSRQAEALTTVNVPMRTAEYHLILRTSPNCYLVELETLIEANVTILGKVVDVQPSADARSPISRTMEIAMFEAEAAALETIGYLRSKSLKEQLKDSSFTGTISGPNLHVVPLAFWI